MQPVLLLVLAAKTLSTLEQFARSAPKISVAFGLQKAYDK
jgi:hypothetical protein